MLKIVQYLKQADSTPPTFVERQLKSQLQRTYAKYNSSYNDQYWKVPNDIMKAMRSILSNITIMETKYDRAMPPKFKQWVLCGGFVDPKGRNRAVWVNMKANGAGSVQDPLDRYDMSVQVETLDPKKTNYTSFFNDLFKD